MSRLSSHWFKFLDKQIQMCSPRMADANSTFCQFKIGLFLFPYLPIPCIMFFRGLIQSTAAYLFIVSLLVDLKIEFENLTVLKLKYRFSCGYLMVQMNFFHFLGKKWMERKIIWKKYYNWTLTIRVSDYFLTERKYQTQTRLSRPESLLQQKRKMNAVENVQCLW